MKFWFQKSRGDTISPGFLLDLYYLEASKVVYFQFNGVLDKKSDEFFQIFANGSLSLFIPIALSSDKEDVYD